MVDTTRVASVVVIIAIISCVAIFHVQMVDLKNKLAAAHAHIDTLAEHVTELRRHQNRQPQPQPRRRVPVSGRRLVSDEDNFDLGGYVRRLKSFKHPAGVNLNNNNSFVLFGKPVDYVLSRTNENLMVAGKQFFVQGQFKASGPMMLPYYTPAVLQAAREACDAGDPNADAIACSLLSYSKIIAVKKALDDVAADLRKFKTNQTNENQLTKSGCMAYTDLHSRRLEQYADKSAGEKADQAETAAKSYVNKTEQKLLHYRQEATDKANAVQKTAEQDIAKALAQAKAYTDVATDAMEITLQSLNETAGVAQVRAAQKAIAESLVHANAYTNKKIEDANKYADAAAVQKAGAAQDAAKKHSDANKLTLQNFATQEATTKADAVRKEATAAISKVKEELSKETRKYTDATTNAKGDDVEALAKKYTDAVKLALESFATKKAGDVQKHADTVAAQALSNATKVAQRLAEAAAVRKAAETRETAQKYTDAVAVKVTAVMSDLTQANSSLSGQLTRFEIQSKAYTDNVAKQTKSYALDTAFPIGSIFITYENTQPQDLFTGTKWQRVAGGRTLVGVLPDSDQGDYGGYNLKQSGLSLPKTWRSTSTHTLSVDQMPTHGHDNAWRWNCDLPKHSTGTTDEKCIEHPRQSDVSYIDIAAMTTKMTTLKMRAAMTWHTTKSKIWRERRDVAATFNGETKGKGKPFSIDIMQPFVTVHMWRRVK